MKNVINKQIVMLKIGQVVFSKKGRDKGLPFVVIESDDEYVYLADGKSRFINRLKKKKIKHVQPTNTVFDLNSYSKRGLQDADIKKLLSSFVNNKEVRSIV